MKIKIPNVDIGYWNLWVCHCPVERNRIEEFWELITNLIMHGLSMCVCMDDFDDLVDQCEKHGGRRVTQKINFYMKKVMEKVEGLDIG